MALYHQLKFPSRFLFDRVGVFMADIIFYPLKFTLMFINERKRNANTYLISNFDSLEAAPFKSTALGSCLVCLGLNSPLVCCDFWCVCVCDLCLCL